MTQSELLNRASGILFHPTSLPGPFGIGDLGPEAHAWIDTLARTGQGWWQVLPVGPTGYGDSPYQSPSTFAGNLNLISPERLADDKLVSRDEVEACRVAGGGSANPSSGPSPEKGGGSAPPSLSGKGVGGLGSEGPIDYADVIPRKQRLVQRAWERFRAGDGNPALRGEFARFYAEEAGWLDEFALFMAIKNAEGGKPWWEWPSPLAMHDGPALDAARQRLADEIDAHRFGQFLFFRQWKAVREHAHQSGVKIIGDLPIYIARDSADVWGHPELFQLDETRQPQVVAGVPPDYFSSTGQLWGNPIYNWTVHHTTRYAWWLDRIRAALRIFDLIRLDHFRGI